MVRPVVALSLALAVGPTPPAAAQDACLDELTDDEVQGRIDHIQGRLDEGGLAARLWWYGWMSTMLAAGVTQTAWALVTDDPQDRRRRAISATGALLTVTGLLVRPFVPAYAPGRLRRADADTPEQRLAKLRLAERLLARSAERERAGSSFLEYGQVQVWNLTTSLILLLRFDDELGALLNAGSALLIGNGRVASTPRRAIRDHREYQAASKPCLSRHLREAPRPTFALHPAGLGVGMTLSF